MKSKHCVLNLPAMKYEAVTLIVTSTPGSVAYFFSSSAIDPQPSFAREYNVWRVFAYRAGRYWHLVLLHERLIFLTHWG